MAILEGNYKQPILLSAWTLVASVAYKWRQRCYIRIFDFPAKSIWVVDISAAETRLLEADSLFNNDPVALLEINSKMNVDVTYLKCCTFSFYAQWIKQSVFSSLSKFVTTA